MRHKLNFCKNRKNDLIPFYRVAVLMALFSLMLPVSVVFARSLRQASSMVSQAAANEEKVKLLAQTQTKQQRQEEAIKLNNQGLELYNQGKYQEALKLFEQALVISREISDKANEAKYLNNIGAIYKSLGMYQKALDYYQQALVITKIIGNKLEEGRYLNNIGEVYRSLGQYEKALDYYQQAFAITKQFGDKNGEGGTYLNNIGAIYRNQGKYQKALDYYQQALAIAKQVGNKDGEGASLNNIGEIYDSLGQYQKALDYYQQALSIAKQIGDKVGESTYINNIGEVYRSLGQYSKALNYYQQALSIAKQIGDKDGEGKIINNIGIVYRSLGQYEKALDYYEQALLIAKQTGDKAGEGTRLGNIGVVYDSQRQYEKALDYYEQALVIAKQIGDKAGEGTRLNNIGAVYDSLRQYQKALNYYQKALTIAQQIGDKVGESTRLNNIGAVYDNQRQYQKALDYYQKALTIAQQIGDKVGEGITLNNIGANYIYQSKYSQSEASLFTAINIWELLRTKLTDDQKISIFEKQSVSYRLLQKALIAQNKIEQALEISERGRARALIDLLASQTKNNRTDTTLQSSNPSITQLKQIAQQQKATFVEYSVIDDSKLYIWVVKPTGEIAFKQVDLKSLKTPLKKLVETTRTDAIGVRGRGINVEPVIGANQQKKLQQLHDLLIAPIAKHLPKNTDEKVIFVPHESLFLVPFPALTDAKGKYLIEKHTILTAPSIQLLEYTHKKPHSPKLASLQPKDILLVGNPTMPIVGIPAQQLQPLPGAGIEAGKIGELLNAQPLIGKQATKSAVLQKIANAKIIHFATHGLLDGFGERVPGAVAFAPDSPGVNEGLLKTTEIINLKLNADLVVLSACDTGKGDITGDGVVGLSRSLLTAGAKSVVVSLWQIPDNSTSELMLEFYRQLQQNPNKAKALRQAMLTTMKKYPHPVYWAAFTLVGEAE
jgi:CHAT domain-containing protein/Flp pilus assembly protein TadD